MKNFHGKYVGVMPVHDSATGYGEFEVTITERSVKFRTATGKGILSESLFTQGFHPMSEEEVGKISEVEGDPADHSVAGFRHSSNALVICFVRQKSSGIGVLFILREGLVGLLDPIPLFDEQSMGQFEVMLAEIEKNGGVGATPRIANGGYGPRGPGQPN